MQPVPTGPAVAGDVQIDAKTGALIVSLGGLVSFDPKLKGDLITDVLVTREDIVQVRVHPGDVQVVSFATR